MEQAQTQPQAQPHTSADWITFLAWLEVNKKRVIMAAGIVLGLIAVASLYAWYSGEKEADASRALSNIQLPFGAGEMLPQSTLDGLKKVVADYAGTKAAVRAELELAAAYDMQGNDGEAGKGFANFLRDRADSQWVSQAYFGVAASLDAEKKTDEALKKYGDFLARYQNDPLADQARLNQGLLYEQTQKLEDAAKLYDRMTKAQSYSTAAREAEGRLHQLYAAHPNLIPSNPPPTKSAMPTVTQGTNRIQVTPKPAGSNAPIIKLTPGTSAAPAAKPAPASGAAPTIKLTPQPAANK